MVKLMVLAWRAAGRFPDLQFSVTPIAIRGSRCQKHIVKLMWFLESVKTHSKTATFYGFPMVGYI